MQTIIITQDKINLGFTRGQVLTLPDNVARNMIAAGYAEVYGDSRDDNMFKAEGWDNSRTKAFRKQPNK